MLFEKNSLGCSNFGSADLIILLKSVLLLNVVSVAISQLSNLSLLLNPCSQEAALPGHTHLP